MTELSAAELEKLGVYSQDDVKTSAFANILLLGHPKIGKTTCVASTAPKPLLINCDGPGAAVGAAKEGGKFLTLDVTGRASWKAAVATAGKLVEAGAVKTLIVDSVSLLYDTLADEISLTLDGFDKWNELHSVGMGGIKKLSQLPAHLFLIAHLEAGKDGAAGILPIIPGQDKKKIGAFVQDWVLLDCVPGRKPERMFLLGPQDFWNASGRNIRRSCAVEATVPALFEELGISL